MSVIQRLHAHIILASFLLVTALSAQNTAAVPIAKAPDWVTPTAVTFPTTIPTTEIEDGTYYLLVENQVKVDNAQPSVLYKHFAELVVNQEGLEEVSQINMNYDPTYQNIVLNSVLVHRGDEVFDRTKVSKIQLLQREAGMEELMYDGHLTANIILDDIRVGDIVEYSYTLTGANPVYQGVFHYDRSIQWSDPVRQLFVRVLWGKPTPLHIKKLHTDASIQERTLGKYKEYTLKLQDTVPARFNSQSPRWFQPYASVYFHEKAAWSEIAQWAASLYKGKIDTTGEVARIAGEISAKVKAPEARVVAALRYVQSTIRYLGIEMGTNSHLPSDAKETLTRRYGDCKDKVVLFISLLKALGIEAYPALVNTQIRDHIAELPPMMNLFDHVLVKVVLGGKTYWLDPTRSYQMGKLENIYQSDYGYALVADVRSKQLESMKAPENLSKSVIRDHYDLSAGAGKEVLFESVNEHQGYMAEDFRYDLASSGVAKLQKHYVEFYSGYYPKIKALMTFESRDDETTGFTTTNR